MSQLNKTEIEKINSEIATAVGVTDFFDKKDNLVLFDAEFTLLVVKDKVPCFFYREGKIIPTLKLLLEKQFLKQVVIDMGAVKFISAGADVMRPGIVEIDPSIVKDELVAVVDQTHKKPLAVCNALFSGAEMQAMKTGKVLKSVHHVGDQVWKLNV